jgi:hypothetical protein
VTWGARRENCGPPWGTVGASLCTPRFNNNAAFSAIFETAGVTFISEIEVKKEAQLRARNHRSDRTARAHPTMINLFSPAHGVDALLNAGSLQARAV